MINKLTAIKLILQQASTVPQQRQAAFYKTGKGDYAEHDRFMGVTVPTLRKIAKDFADLKLEEIQKLLTSRFNEQRLLALFILILQYQSAESSLKNKLYQFYTDNLSQVNNWNLVDASAHLIIGAHLFNADKSSLLALAKSTILWERRIAIVATWYFIRKDNFKWTFKIANILLNDHQDLIHKAVGWMLRETGKRDQPQLLAFLDQQAEKMPRTMLRYAIEKLSEDKRQNYLLRKNP